MWYVYVHATYSNVVYLAYSFYVNQYYTGGGVC